MNEYVLHADLLLAYTIPVILCWHDFGYISM